MSTVGRDLLDPALLARVEQLKLQARIAAEGALSGLHRSKHHGASVEFAEHKEYAPGDEIRHIDWRVFGKSDKYYVKRYEQETNLNVMMLADTSASMLYQSDDATHSKWGYASRAAAALSYLLLRQQDAVGLVLAGEDVSVYVPPRSRSTHLMHLCELLVRGEPQPETPTNLLAGATRLLEVCRRRGLVFVLSDFLDTDPHFFEVLKQLRSRRQYVTLLHVLDPWELDFPFDDMTVFKSLETGRELLTEPRAMRDAYLREFRAFVSGLRRRCLESGIDYRLFDTRHPLEDAMTSFLTRLPQQVPEG